MAQVFDVELGARGELRLAAGAPAAPPTADGGLPGAAPVLALVPTADAHAPLPRHTIPLAQLVGCAAPRPDAAGSPVAAVGLHAAPPGRPEIHKRSACFGSL